MEFFEMKFDESFVAVETNVNGHCIDFSAPQLEQKDSCFILNEPSGSGIKSKPVAPKALTTPSFAKKMSKKVTKF